MKRLFGTLIIGGMLLGSLVPPPAPSAAPGTMFTVRSTATAPEAVVEAVQAYAEGKQWQYLGADKVKRGQMTLVKLCIPEVGQQIWPVGLHLSAMLPCGNLGVYQQGGTTEMSLLHPRYMPMLYPDPALDNASAIAEPLLLEMLEAVTK